MRRHPQGAVAAAGRDPSVHGVVQQRRSQRRRHRLHLRHLHHLPLPSPLPVAQRRDDRHHGVSGVQREVRIVGAHSERRSLGIPTQVADAADRSQHRAEAQEILVRPDQPLHRLVGRHDRRIDLAQLLVALAPIRDHARRVIRQEHVRLLDHAARHRRGAGRGHVEQERQLGGVEVVEVPAQVVRARLPRRERLPHPQRVDPGLTFDPDHLRAEVGQRPARDRSGAEPGEVGHANTVQRPRLGAHIAPSDAYTIRSSCGMPSSSTQISMLCCPIPGAGRRIVIGVSLSR